MSICETKNLSSSNTLLTDVCLSLILQTAIGDKEIVLKHLLQRLRLSLCHLHKKTLKDPQKAITEE